MHICTIHLIIPNKSYLSHVANLIPTSYASCVEQNSPRQAYVRRSRHHQSVDRGKNSVLKKMLLQQFKLPIHSPPHSRPVPATNFAEMAKRYKLNTGAEIPAIGFGTWQDESAQEEAVTEAIKAGYRHIDTARV